MRYSVWAIARIGKGLVKLLILYPIALLMYIPTKIYTAVCIVSQKLDQLIW